jgi:hypothetical protein
MAQIGDLGGELNLLCRHGHTIGPFDITWTDELNAPVNISSALFTSVIYTSATNLTPVSEFDIVITSGVDGNFSVSMLPANCTLLPIVLHY